LPRNFDTPLPIDAVLGDLSRTLEAHNAAVLVAPPGAGKTTRVPLALLDAPWAKAKKIIVLEPRRIAARASADRMAKSLGERAGETVGYRVRFGSKISRATRIEVVTEGIFTRQIMDDPELSGVAAVLFVTVLTIVAAQVSIPLPFTPVPFTLQPMVVLLGGAALGSRLGMTSQVLYLALGIAGLPVFAASPILPQGFARLLGPTGGYLMSYPIAAFVAGYLAERGFDRRYATSVLAMFAGLAIIFTFLAVHVDGQTLISFGDPVSPNPVALGDACVFFP